MEHLIFYISLQLDFVHTCYCFYLEKSSICFPISASFSSWVCSLLPSCALKILTVSLQTWEEGLKHEIGWLRVQDLVDCLGKDPATKSDEFLGKFQTAFDPPLIFGKSYCKFFMMDMVAFMLGGIGHKVSVNINTVVETSQELRMLSRSLSVY